MNKKNTFTLIEIMVSFAILITALTGIFLVLNTGESFSPINLGRVNVSAKSRIIMKRITNNLKNSVVGDIADYSPSCSYLKFRKVQGAKTDGNGGYIYSYSLDTNGDGINDYNDCTDYFEYSYNPDTNKLKYSYWTVNNADSSIISESVVEYENITENIFYILDSAGTLVCLNSSDLFSQEFIIVNIKIEEEAGAADNVGFSLTQRVKIRNE